MVQLHLLDLLHGSSATWMHRILRGLEKLGEAEKKGKFTEFILEKVNLSKLDEYTLLAGLVTPPAAMALKRVGESVPQIKVIKMIPDVIFVPGATLAALVSVKLTRLMSLGKQI
ncbi:hypothetical protein Syun_018523 [Stephania yunnanensis]|uniref:Uncharacterized protein n=1 Tax=Stephania yunnanensis TaxID=152371 RepID=A0AAP0ISG1_9MAGN